MLRLLERDIATVSRRLVVLAPPQRAIPDCFTDVTPSPSRHGDLLQMLQRLRGNVYLGDGAIEQDQLSPDGRHATPEDEGSWHLVMLDGARRVSGCIWYREHERPAFKGLRVRDCPLARSDEWHDKLRRAVDSDIERAGREQIGFAEVGGWAVAPDNHGTSDGLLLALGAYSLSQITGQALVITTATSRHCSATMLRRIGGSWLETDGTALPPYYDSKYRCEMELLRFDSRRPNPKYAGLIDQLRMSIMRSEVIESRVVAPAREQPEYVQDLPRAALAY
jgi:hypothetical protein